MTAKAILAKEMDNIICNEICDETIWEWWIVEGCPDCSTTADYEWYNEDEDSFKKLTDLFLDIMMLTIERE